MIHEMKHLIFLLFISFITLVALGIVIVKVQEIHDFYVKNEVSNTESLKQIASSLERIASKTESLKVTNITGIELSSPEKLIGSYQLIPELSNVITSNN